MFHLIARFGVAATATFALMAAPASADAVAPFPLLPSPAFSTPTTGDAVALFRSVPAADEVTLRAGRRPADRLMVEPDPAHPDEPLPVRRAPTGRIVAGTAVDIRTAPWQVFLLSENASGTTTCGGSILNATTVLTAAHCLEGLTIGAPFDQNGLQVVAGMSNVDVEVPTDQPQSRRVVAARVHPLYTGLSERLPEGDVAVLALASPLDLSQATAQPIALPASTAASVDGEPVPVGPAVRATGFGVQAGGPAGTANGQLYALDAAVIDPDECGPHPNAVGICVRSASGSICSGDSGGGLVAAGALVGVVSSGPETCAPGSWARYTSLLAPENYQFVIGAAAVPTAPRQTAAISGAASPPQVGGSLTCSGGAFAGAGVSVKWVVANDLGQRLAAVVAPTVTYAIAPGDAGHTLTCRAFASNAGGVATSESLVSPVIEAAPIAVPPPASDRARTSLQAWAPKRARRGSRFKLYVTITNPPSDAIDFRVRIDRPTLSSRNRGKGEVRRSKKPGPGTVDRVSFVQGVTMPKNAVVGRRYRIHVEGEIWFPGDILRRSGVDWWVLAKR